MNVDRRLSVVLSVSNTLLPVDIILFLHRMQDFTSPSLLPILLNLSSHQSDVIAISPVFGNQKSMTG